MTGMNMMLSALGVTPDAVEKAKKDIYDFASQVKQKIESMDARLAAIESTQAEIVVNQVKLAQSMSLLSEALTMLVGENNEPPMETFSRFLNRVSHA